MYYVIFTDFGVSVNAGASRKKTVQTAKNDSGSYENIVTANT
jgi:hypothetical protein